jgi:hypothetical protein
MKFRVLLVLVLGLCIGISGQPRAQASSTSPITIEQPWARATPSGARTGAAYLTIVNRGSAGDRLVSASTPLVVLVPYAAPAPRLQSVRKAFKP